MNTTMQERNEQNRTVVGPGIGARCLLAVLIVLVLALMGSPTLYAAEILPNPNPVGNTITLPGGSDGTVSGNYINAGL